MNTTAIEYTLGNLVMEGFVARMPSSKPQPIVFVVHDWAGNRELAQNKAEFFAKQGYVGFAVDLYGKGKRGSDTDKSINQRLMGELMEDRSVIVPRLQAAVECAQKLDNVATDQVILIGFCLGGLCALDYARSGAKVNGVISVHGLLNNDGHLPIKPTQAKILVLHGYQDPMVTPDQILTFASEMLARKADWQIHIFGNCQHAFTNPKAHDNAAGLMFNQTADARTWQLVKNFTTEVFGLSNTTTT